MIGIICYNPNRPVFRDMLSTAWLAHYDLNAYGFRNASGSFTVGSTHVVTRIHASIARDGQPRLCGILLKPDRK
jgi:hypothetical protein